MHDAIVTFVDEETDDHGRTTVITKVYRLEFDNPRAFEYWLRSAPSHTISIEQLVAKED